MTVGTILSAKGREVVTTQPGANLTVAAKLLAEKRIGALLIIDSDHRIVGILSERDIVRAIAQRGAVALDDFVSTAMTRDVMTCKETETIASIMDRMTAGRFRHLPVINQGQLVGMISIGDVVKYRVHEMERDTTQMREYILTA